MSEVLVTIKQGQIRGSSSTDISGKKYFSFLGIPYAKPPLGNLRFKDPEPPEPWTGIRDGTVEGDMCYAKEPLITSLGMFPIYLGSEDCLYLDVSTPSISEGDALPVMMFIPGGAFSCGSSTVLQYGPKFLLTKNVVVVNMNYRVGCLGFLSLESQGVGNAGLKDTVLALKWIRDNIAQFGGDPKNVTVFGQSAGAAAVQYLLISPLANNLMHKGIAQSGSALATWSVGKQNNARDIAKVMGCTDDDDAGILQFLQNVTKEDLLSAQNDKLGDPLSVYKLRYFCPTVEPPSPNAFITEIPADLLLAGKIHQMPFMLGYNSMEGMFFAGMKGLQNIFPIDYTNIVPHYVGDANPELNRQIMRFYFGQDDVDMTNKEALYRVATDVDFARPGCTAVRNQAVKSSQSVYLYRFSCETQLNSFKKMMRITTPGVPHGDETNYLFSNATEAELEPGSPEWLGKERMVTMWTNFAKTGIPIPAQDDLLNAEWKPVEEGKLNYLDIGNELVAGTDPDGERVKFWDQVYGELSNKY